MVSSGADDVSDVAGRGLRTCFTNPTICARSRRYAGIARHARSGTIPAATPSASCTIAGSPSVTRSTQYAAPKQSGARMSGRAIGAQDVPTRTKVPDVA